MLHPMRYLDLPATDGVRRSRRGVTAFWWSKAARPLRFACTGGTAALVQLAILDALIDVGWPPILANVVALLLSTQVNFVPSYLFTWHDRRPAVGTPLVVLGRWAAYQGSVTGAAVLNMAIFVVARADLHALVVSALGTAVAAIINFVAGDRLVFRRRRVST